MKSHGGLREYARLLLKNFLIYYWVDDENNRVQVTAVIYSRRDQIRQLSNMDME